MRVAIDIRRAGDFGLGTYIRNIVNQLARIDGDSQYLLIGQRRHLAEFDPLPQNFELLEYAYQPGTFRTHLHLPWLLRQRRVDILHMPWFYAPAVVPSRLLITVHDLSDVLAPLVGASTPVQTGRLFFARRALNRADHIFAVSQSSKRDLARAFHIPEAKISVVYNAVDERFLNDPLPADADRILERHAVTSPFVLYAGNIKPAEKLAAADRGFCGGQSGTALESGIRPAQTAGDRRSAEPPFGSAQRRGAGAGARRRALPGIRAQPRAAGFLFAGARRSCSPRSTKASDCRRSKPWPTGRRCSLPTCRRCRKSSMRPLCW